MSKRSSLRHSPCRSQVAWLAALGCCVLLFSALAPALAQPASSSPPVVLRVHARSVDTTVTALRGYLPVPLKPEAALDSLMGALGQTVRLDAPVDLVLSLDGKSTENPGPPLWIVALPVRSLEAVRKGASQSGLSIDTQGLFSRLQFKSGGDTWHCLLGPGPGAAARLACGLNERSREELGGYTIALPALRTSADLRAELYIDTLVQTYDSLLQRALQLVGVLVPQKLQLGQAQFDRALTDATQAIVGQFAAMSRDMRRLTLDLTLTGTGADARLTYEMGTQTSWWGQADALSASMPPAPPPALFWGLRKDYGAASFATSDLRFLRQFLNLLSPLLEGFLTYDGLAPADRQAVIAVLQGLPLSDGWLNSVFAEVAALTPDATRGDRRGPESLFRGASYILASDAKKGLTTDWLKSLAAAYKRPGVQNYLRNKWKLVAKTEPLPLLRMQPAAKSLGAGATLFTVTLTVPSSLERLTAGRAGQAATASKASAAPWVLHLLSVPRGEQTWMAVGSDPNVLSAQLLAQLTVSEDATLAKRPGLEGLQQPALRSGGFTSLQSMARYLETALSMSRMRRAAAGGDKAGLADIGQLFNMIPHHGETPLVYSSRVRRGSDGGKGDALTGEIALSVPRTALEDVVALVMHLAL